jgi:5-(carboxyamino)imidazole ribonucleotide synthase
MLIQAGLNFNLSISILDPDKDAPCKSIADVFQVGSLTDFDTVYAFGKKVDLLTIEIEHVNVEALEKLEQEGVKVFPQPHIIKTIQDKGLQKLFYKEHNIPTADFRLIQSHTELAQHTDFFPYFQKLRKGGYDGKGVQRIRNENDFSKAFEQPCVLEKQVDIHKELAVIVARNESGEIKTFPAVELDFHPEANLVEFLFSPADISSAIEKKVEEIAIQVAESLKIVGLLAVEMFLTNSGEILVNEIAPRVHNSGHHTIEGNITSQFEQHLRAILGLPLGSAAIKVPAVMVNLLGEPTYDGTAKYAGLDDVLKVEGVAVHLYGKKFTRPFRKMGHVTVTDASLETAKEKAKFVKDTLKVIA